MLSGSSRSSASSKAATISGSRSGRGPLIWNQPSYQKNQNQIQGKCLQHLYHTKEWQRTAQNSLLPDVGAARLSSPSSCSYLEANASLGNFTLPNYKLNQKLHKCSTNESCSYDNHWL